MNRPIAIVLLIVSTAATLPANETPHLQVKNQSAFTLQGNRRNPFWPIGWKPAAPQATDSQADAQLSPNAFMVSSIAMQAGGRFAIINGKIMQEGQEFGLKLGEHVYRVTLQAIQDGRVIIGQQGHQIIVPLTRK